MTEQRDVQRPAELVQIRPLAADDLDAADRVMRIAFGTFLGAPDPIAVFGDAQYVRPRYQAAPSWAFAAELDGEIVGSNFATRWGSFAFFGPLTVRPDLWDRGIASRLMEPVIDLFEQWGVRQAGLFTFPNSPKHIGLYQKYAFFPQYLTPLMETRAPAPRACDQETFSRAPDSERDAIISACRELTGAIYDGLDVSHEIVATDTQQLGDTVLLRDNSELDAFAVCHCNAGEAGSGTCFIKFAAVRPGDGAPERFERLLDACDALAADHALERIVAGVNTARHDAYRRMLGHGYRTWLEGLIMQRPNNPGYCRPDAYVIDDLR